MQSLKPLNFQMNYYVKSNIQQMLKTKSQQKNNVQIWGGEAMKLTKLALIIVGLIIWVQRSRNKALIEDQ